jgi:hypothetical protein
MDVLSADSETLPGGQFSGAILRLMTEPVAHLLDVGQNRPVG